MLRNKTKQQNTEKSDVTLKVALLGSYSDVLVLLLQKIYLGLCHSTGPPCVLGMTGRTQAGKASQSPGLQGAQSLTQLSLALINNCHQDVADQPAALEVLHPTLPTPISSSEGSVLNSACLDSICPSRPHSNVTSFQKPSQSLSQDHLFLL